MDTQQILKSLYEQRQRTEDAIAAVEALAATPGLLPERRRGRKSMSAQERLEVSRRMRAYWASRRAEKTS